MESRIERMCVELGLKMTGQRRVIARVLSEATDHPDVEELYRRASAIDPKVSIATVYRTVRLLEEKGILERRDFGEGRSRYDPTDRGHHHHLICRSCGLTVEIQASDVEEWAHRTAAANGFTQAEHIVDIFGVCAACSAARADEKRGGA